MKSIRLIAAAAILLLPCVVAAQPFEPNILLLNEQCTGIGTSVAYFPPVLAAMGLTFTETGNGPDFLAALENGTEWDLVLVDEYSSNLDSGILSAISDYVADGGRCILSY